MRKDLASCPQKFFLNHVLRIKPKGINIHLHFGACFARGLEVMRLAHYQDGKPPMEAFAAGAEAIIKTWGDVEPDFHSTKTLESCLIALYSFIIEYPLEHDRIKPLMTEHGAAVEWTFALPIPNVKHPETGEPITYCGRFDMLAEYNNTVYVNDEKTASQLGKNWQTNWELASQLTGYCWAAKTYGFPVAGAVIRGVQILKQDIRFALVIEQREQWKIDRWLYQLQRDLRRAIECWKEGYWDFALDEACSSYGGCPNLPICTAAEPQRVIDFDYEPNTWDPLEKVEAA